MTPIIDVSDLQSIVILCEQIRMESANSLPLYKAGLWLLSHLRVLDDRT